MATAEQQEKPKDGEHDAPRAVGEIQQDIESTRARLVGNLEQLKQETSPQALKEKASTKAGMGTSTTSRSSIPRPNGSSALASQ